MAASHRVGHARLCHDGRYPVPRQFRWCCAGKNAGRHGCRERRPHSLVRPGGSSDSRASGKLPYLARLHYRVVKSAEGPSGSYNGRAYQKTCATVLLRYFWIWLGLARVLTETQVSSPCSIDHFPSFLARLPPELDIERLARDTKAFRRRHGVRCGTDLLRLVLARGPGGRSLQRVVAWAGECGIAMLSDEALVQRLHGAGGFLEAVSNQLLTRVEAAACWHGPDTFVVTALPCQEARGRAGGFQENFAGPVRA